MTELPCYINVSKICKGTYRGVNLRNNQFAKTDEVRICKYIRLKGLRIGAA